VVERSDTTGSQRRSTEEGPRRRTPTPATSNSSRQKSRAPTTINRRKQHSAGPSARRRCFKRSHGNRRDRTPGDDAEGSNPHKQPAYQARRFHAVSVKRPPLSRHGLLEQGTRLWLGLSPATPHDSTRVIVRPRRLVPSPHNLILHRFSSRFPPYRLAQHFRYLPSELVATVRHGDERFWVEVDI
jgi:hypothetical protein